MNNSAKAVANTLVLLVFLERPQVSFGTSLALRKGKRGSIKMMMVNLLNERVLVTNEPIVSFGELARLHASKILAIAFLSLVFSAALNNAWRMKIRAFLFPPFRVVLSVVQADVDGAGHLSKILKVKTDQGLYLEVYGEPDPQRGNLQPLLAAKKLMDSRDGYFTLNGHVTNLAVDDIDNDSRREIIAASFDDNMVAHLNVYRYDAASMSLQKIATEGNTLLP